MTDKCIVTIKNATFNLLPLHLSPIHDAQIRYYQVKDERSESNADDDYKYAFNVCGPVLTIPDGCHTNETDPVNNFVLYLICFYYLFVVRIRDKVLKAHIVKIII